MTPRQRRQLRTSAPVATVLAVLYTRVSSKEQIGGHALSLSNQEEKLRGYAKAMGYTVVEVVTDAGVSAASLDRKGLQHAFDLLDEGKANTLVVVKLDRLTRSLHDLGNLIEGRFQKHNLVSLSEEVNTRTAAGRLVLNVLGSVALWEREIISERTSAAMQHMRDTNLYTGGKARFGFKTCDEDVAWNKAHPDDKKAPRLVEVPQEQAAIKKALSLKSSGLSLRAISEQLAKEGYLARSGKPLDAKAVSIILAEHECVMS